MKKSIFLFFLLPLLFFKGYCQNIITGIIYFENQQPVKKAIIGYKYDTYSTISNEEGRFEIPPSNIKEDSLFVDYIGYETYKISKKEITSNLQIILSNPYKEIESVIIQPINIKATLDSVLANYSKNYPENILYTGIYKEGNFKDYKLNKYSQAEIQFNILKNKKNKFLINENQSFKSNNDPSVIFFKPLLLDIENKIEVPLLLKNLISNLDKYKIKTSKSSYNNSPVIILIFKKSDNEDNYYRKITIDAETYALIQYSNYLPTHNKFRLSNIILESKANKIEINYRPFKDKYILSSINGEILGVSFDGNQSQQIKSYFQFITNDVCSFHCKFFNTVINSKRPILNQIKEKPSILNNNIQNKDEYEFLKYNPKNN